MAGHSLKPGGVPRQFWWSILAILALALAVELSASNALAGAPIPNNPTGMSGAPNAGKSGELSPSVPLTCTNDYVITTSTGNAIDPGTTDIGNHTDDGNTTIALPFTFYLYGTGFSNVNVGSNGKLEFTSNNEPGGYTNSCLPAATYNNVIFAHWDDLYTVDSANGQGIFTSVVGTTPNRIFNIEWRAQFCCSGGAPVVNFEARLYEALGGNGGSQFDLVYGAVSGNGVGATIGVQEGTGTHTSQFSCNTASTSSGLLVHFEQNCTGPTFTPTNTPTRTNTPTPTPTPFCTPPSFNTTISAGATVIPGTTDIGNHTDDGTTNIVLPFTYNFAGAPYTSANVSSNGNIQFNSANGDYVNICLPASLFVDTIFAHWDDLRTDVTGTVPSGIFTAVQGVTPNRILIIEWRTVYFGTTTSLNFEVLLHEGAAGNFEIIYGVLNGTGAGATVGAQKDTGSVYNQVECNTGGLSTGEMISFTYSVGTCPSPTPTNTPTRTNTPTATPTQICPGSWTAQAAYPASIMDNAVASQGGFVYSFGGYDGSAVVAAANKYDPGSNTWSPIMVLPAAREAPRAVSDGTYIYILGGWDSSGVASSTLYRYDPVGNSYTTLAPFSQPAAAPGAAYLSGKIYKAGGCTSTCGMTTAEVYDITGNTWAPIAAYPTIISWNMMTGITSGVNAGKVLAAGGADSGTTATTKTYAYDPSTNTWNDVAVPDLPDNTRWAAASEIVKKKWILAGGVINNFSSVTNTAVAYDPNSNNWSVIDPMLAARYRMTGGTLGTAPGSAAFYVVGGSSGGFNPTANNQRFLDICQPTLTPTPTTLICTPPPNTPTPAGTPPTMPPTKTRTITPTITPTPTGTPPTATPTTACCNYVFTQACGGIIVPGTHDIGVHCDDCSTYITMPFVFNLYDGNYPIVPLSGTLSNAPQAKSPPIMRPSANGFVTFYQTPQPEYAPAERQGKPALANPGDSPGVNICLPPLDYEYTIFPYWDDLRTDPNPGCASYPGGNCGIFTSTSGVAPNRIFSMEWRAVFYTNTAQLANFELRLHEGTGNFEVIYGQVDQGGANSTVGVQKNPKCFTQFECNTGGVSQGLVLTFTLPCATPTHTPTPAVTPVLVVHILFQGIPTPNPIKYITDTVTTTLRLVGGGPGIEYGPVGPDGYGFYTIPVGTVPNGTYIIRAKGHKNLSSGGAALCDTVTLTGAPVTQKDLGTLRAGDALSTGPTNFNVVNASDFTTLKNTFGKAFGQPGYDERADFNQTDNVDASDFSLMKGNFGSAGCPNP